MKKYLAILLALVLVIGLAACGGTTTTTTTTTTDQQTTTNNNNEPATTNTEPAAEGEPAAATEITLWTYPIGNWGNEEAVKALTDAFTAETGIKVTVEYLTYADGDDKVNTAITAKAAPDLIMEGPERLVANWGANGYMVDISDLFDDTDKAELNAAALAACFTDAGAAYEYPLVMTAHCMAINWTAFVEAGADQYVDRDSHTWTTQQYLDACAALYAYYGDTFSGIYCSGQGGDQGTRALVNNLYGGTFTTADHSAYTWDNELNVKALKTLYDLQGVEYDPSINGGEEIANFYNGIFKMAYCWNIAQQLNPNSAGTGAGLTATGDEIVFMAFPADGDPALQGGIWGFGIFDNGDAARIEAAKQFIKYFCDSEHTADAVRTANYFAARSAAEGTDLSAIWADNEIMNEYTKLMPYLGDYYQVTKGWAQARTAWWNMLQQVGASDGSEEAIAAAVASFAAEANAAAQG